MKHLLTTLAAALALTAGAWAQQAAVYGTLLKHKTDPELLRELPSTVKEYLVIRFGKPFEIYHENWENEGGKDSKVRINEVQLFCSAKDSEINALIGKKVIAVGETMERNTANQMCPILFSVAAENIKEGAFVAFGVGIK